MTEGPWHLPHIAVYVRKFAHLQTSTGKELSIVISYVARNRTRLVRLTSAVNIEICSRKYPSWLNGPV